jgi:hypothetical protein
MASEEAQIIVGGQYEKGARFSQALFEVDRYPPQALIGRPETCRATLFRLDFGPDCEVKHCCFSISMQVMHANRAPSE